MTTTMASFVYNIPGVRQLQTKLNQLTSYIPPPPSNNDDNAPKKILLVQAHPEPIRSFSGALAEQVETAAHASGHEIQRISLYASRRWQTDYPAKLSNEEWKHSQDSGEDLEQRILPKDAKEHLRLLKWCDTLILLYPTWWMNTPAALKGFFDRTLVHDLAWSMPPADPNGRTAPQLVPKLTNIRQIVGISTYGAPHPFVTLAGDNGRRMIANAVRPMICPDATVQWLGLYGIHETTLAQRQDFLTQVQDLVRNL